MFSKNSFPETEYYGIFLFMDDNLNNKIAWIKPEVADLGSARNIIKDHDVDGTGDAFAPLNLASI